MSLMFVVCCEGSDLGDGLFTRSEESYQLFLSTSTMRRTKPELGFCATGNEVVTTTIRLITVFYHVVSICLASVDSYKAAVWRHIQENRNIPSHGHENLESYKTDMIMMMMMIIIIIIISNIILLKPSGFFTLYMVLALR